ncbi:MAG: TetR/AcrR family transcriptional regulator, partial [Acidimicrobiia bacterium]|nr:TetR/AcrR family transcriptional regulator [Acidimicrobiia bacterium]
MPARTRSVGRPRTFDEEQVLDRALEVFWQRGYQGATARVLEAELDITQSSIFNAFGSKRNLLGLALDGYERRID